MEMSEQEEWGAVFLAQSDHENADIAEAKLVALAASEVTNK